jgi:hypothetical protein
MQAYKNNHRWQARRGNWGFARPCFFAKDMIEELKKYNSIKLEIVGKANINEWMGRKTP